MYWDIFMQALVKSTGFIFGLGFGFSLLLILLGFLTTILNWLLQLLVKRKNEKNL